ncbi:MAG: VIT and VWA domain-containing protein [Candidatus Nitrotoga sp.]
MNSETYARLAKQQSDMSGILESVRVTGHLRDLACELLVQQNFMNPGEHNVEAVYTFPLPHGAVLLNLTAKVGERKLRGVVLPRKKAEARYEQAITDGDGAIMLERSDDGICTVNLGNLMPGERATLNYEYAYLLCWQQDKVQFRLPTTIAPRYGSAIAAGYQPHQVPVTDMLEENHFSLKLSVEGLLSGAQFDCPSHAVAVQRKDNATTIALQDQCAFMDRDFVLNLKQAGSNKSAGQVAWDELSKNHVALASFCPDISGEVIPSICAKIVVDCSGSMNGDSIRQAQAGLQRIMDNLRETDTFNVVRFGNDQCAFFSACVEANGRSLRNARRAIDELAADMGGTEMGSALDYAYALKDEGVRPAAILLITDGEISNHRDVIRRAVKSGHRVFTVGVGSSVAEEFVRDIAKRTGGACELVTPNENMGDVIFRQFVRMFQPSAVKVDIEWPGKALWQTPSEIGPIFAGDTLHVFASLADKSEGEAKLILHMADGRELTQSIVLGETKDQWHALPRVAVAERINEIDDTQNSTLAEALAIDYQLVTKHTNFLILDVKAEDDKAEDLPQLAQIRQMLAAGWGGTSTVGDTVVDYPAIMRCSRASTIDAFDIPMFLRKSLDTPVVRSNQSRYSVGEPAIAMSLTDKIVDMFKPARLRKTNLGSKEILSMVSKAGDGWLSEFLNKILPRLPMTLQKIFQKLVDEEGWREQEIAAAILFAIASAIIGSRRTSNQLNEAFATVHPTLLNYVKACIVVSEKKVSWKNAFDCLPSKEMEMSC